MLLAIDRGFNSTRMSLDRRASALLKTQARLQREHENCLPDSLILE